MMYWLVYIGVALLLWTGVLFWLPRRYPTGEEEVPERPNRRERFRLSVYGVTCNYVYLPGVMRAYGSVIDISSTGMKMHTFQDIPTDKSGAILLSFPLGGVDFLLQGTIVRKKKHNDYRYEYGIQFHHAKEKEQEVLFQTIWRESNKRIAVS